MDVVRRYRVTWTWERGGSGTTLVQAYTSADAVAQVRLWHSGPEIVHYRVEPDPADDCSASTDSVGKWVATIADPAPELTTDTVGAAVERVRRADAAMDAAIAKQKRTFEAEQQANAEKLAAQSELQLARSALLTAALGKADIP